MVQGIWVMGLGLRVYDPNFKVHLGPVFWSHVHNVFVGLGYGGDVGVGKRVEGLGRRGEWPWKLEATKSPRSPASVHASIPSFTLNPKP